MLQTRRNTRSGLITLILALVAGVAAPAHSQLDTDAVDEAVLRQMETQQAVGVAIGVIQDGEVTYVSGYGLADRERSIPVDENTMFRWASISKPLTAITAAQLAEAGSLDLDADVRGLVPEFPDQGTPITSRQLLGHLGGIVHYRNGPVIPTQRTYDRDNPFEDVTIALDLFRESPLVAVPGEKFAYTTHGFILASAAVQRAGQAPFHQQVAERIADPLGLDSLQPDYQWVAIPCRATGYRKSGDQVVRSTDTDVSWKLGGGGFISNIGDLARFAAALDDEAFITPAMKRMLFTSQKTSGGKATGYGMGFRTKKTNGGMTVSHTGAQEKVRGLMSIELTTKPNQEAPTGDGLVILTNSEHVNVNQLANAIRKAISGTPESR